MKNGRVFLVTCTKLDSEESKDTMGWQDQVIVYLEGVLNLEISVTLRSPESIEVTFAEP